MTIDARLVAPAAAAWAAAGAVLAAGLALGWRGALTTAIAIAACAALGIALARAGAAVGAAAIAGVIAASLHAMALWQGPVAELVDDRARVSVTGIAQAAPRERRGPAWAGTVRGWFPFATSTLEHDGRSLRVEVPLEATCTCAPDALSAGALLHIEGRLAPARGAAVAGALRAERITILRGPGPIDAVAGSVRDGLRQAVAGLPAERAGLVTGLAVGDTALIPPLLEDEMRAAGLSHLTAVSGGNVAIVVGAVLALSAALRLRARAWLALAAVGAFAVLVGPQPSVVRASAMAAIAIVALLTGGRRAGPSVLAASVLLLVLVNPALALSWGFALSAGATCGLVWLAPRLRARTPVRVPPALAEALALTVAAQLTTLPVLLAMGATVSWASVPANLLAMPAVVPVTVLGLLAALLGVVWVAGAAALAWLASWPAAWIAGVAGWALTLPAAELTWPEPPAGYALLGGALLFWPLVRRLRRRHPHALATTIAITVALVLIDPPGRRAWPPPDWRMVACDVGQGDAIVLRGAEPGAGVLVDAGPQPRLLATCLRDLGIARLEAVVLTHFHADHVDGLAAALELPVGAVLVTGTQEPADRAAETLALVRAAGVEPTTINAGTALSVPGIELRALWPAHPIDAGSVPNNASIVMVGDLGGPGDSGELRVLLAGDVEREAQAEIARTAPIGAAVLKVPHHGSANLDPAFVAWAHAPIALFSVGEGNDYGHPAARALEVWAPALIGRTDTDGALAVVLRDGRPALVRRG